MSKIKEWHRAAAKCIGDCYVDGFDEKLFQDIAEDIAIHDPGTAAEGESVTFWNNDSRMESARADAAESALAQREAELKEAVGLLRKLCDAVNDDHNLCDKPNDGCLYPSCAAYQEIIAFLARTGEGTTPPAEGKET